MQMAPANGLQSGKLERERKREEEEDEISSVCRKRWEWRLLSWQCPARWMVTLPVSASRVVATSTTDTDFVDNAKRVAILPSSYSIGGAVIGSANYDWWGYWPHDRSHNVPSCCAEVRACRIRAEARFHGFRRNETVCSFTAVPLARARWRSSRYRATAVADTNLSAIFRKPLSQQISRGISCFVRRRQSRSEIGCQPISVFKRCWNTLFLTELEGIYKNLT